MINVEMLWSTLPEGTVAPAGQAPGGARRRST